MIPYHIVTDMILNGALQLKKGESSDSPFFINYVVVQEKYPQYMEQMILDNLNPIEQYLWQNGLVHYRVTDDGLLEWSATIAGKRMALYLSHIVDRVIINHEELQDKGDG